jgi:hypothetical protein
LLPKVNNAFEEDFGALLRGEVTIGDLPDHQVDDSSVGASVECLLAAMSELPMNKQGEGEQEQVENITQGHCPMPCDDDALAWSFPMQPQTGKEVETISDVTLSRAELSSETAHEVLGNPSSEQNRGVMAEGLEIVTRRGLSLAPKDMMYAGNTELSNVEDMVCFWSKDLSTLGYY